MNDPLDLLLAEGVIDEVMGRLKSGKEAEVWLVSHAGEVVAAKVYKERQARSFKNNAAYKEGRAVRNTRTQRAMAKGSRFGRAAAEDAWKSAEADALYKLHAEGVRVPTPVMFYEGVLLMQLVLDAEGSPAPRLIDSGLSPGEAGAVYRDLRSQVVRMLCCDLIHGDLSPYNVLMGGGGPTIIDFPQVISAAHNNRSEAFFRRDLDNLRHHLGGLDRSLLALGGDASEIWRAYVRRELTPDFVPSERPQAEPREPREHRGAPPGGRPHHGPGPRSDRGDRQGGPRHDPGHGPERGQRQGGPRHDPGHGPERGQRQGGSPGHGPERGQRQGGGPRQGPGPGPDRGPGQGGSNHGGGHGPERGQRQGGLRHGGAPGGRNGPRRPGPEVTYVSVVGSGGVPPGRSPSQQAAPQGASQGGPPPASPQTGVAQGHPRANANPGHRREGHPRQGHGHAAPHRGRHGYRRPSGGSGQDGQPPPGGEGR